jgi:hypothetical protein
MEAQYCILIHLIVVDAGSEVADTGSASSGWDPVTGFCKHGNETSP